MKRNVYIADAASDSFDNATDVIDLIFAAVITVCNHILDGLVSIAPGKVGGFIGVGTVWLITIAIIMLGVREVIFKQLKVK